MDFQRIIDKYYPADSELRDIFMAHSRQVASLALEILEKKSLSLDKNMVETAAMLHDIGIFMTDARGIGCRGSHPYILHGRLGADLLRKEGVAEEIALVAERHTGSGISVEDIARQNLPLSTDRSYMPESLLEKLICYADKFYSKSGKGGKKTVDEIRIGMRRHSTESLERFDNLHRIFGEDNHKISS